MRSKFNNMSLESEEGYLKKIKELEEIIVDLEARMKEYIEKNNQ